MASKKRQGLVASDKSAIVARLPHACRDEQAAVEFMEEQRWGSEPYCPHCGTVGACYQMRNLKTGGRSARFLWRCRACNKQFTVRVGTVLEDSRIPLMHWCLGFWLACASKKGVSALQIKRLTGLSYKSALFMMHRIRFAMSDNPQTPRPLEGTVEADETYVGGRPRHPQLMTIGGRKPMSDTKACVLALVERGGEIRPFHVPKGQPIKRVVLAHVSPDAVLMTDEASGYKKIGQEFAEHHAVMHSVREYVRGFAHTNTAESFFSLLKRGIYGTFHSVSVKHLHRYLGEFQYRYNTRHVDDGERTAQAIRKAAGKRLEYRRMVNG
jgi:transposase-like protein